MDNLGTDDLGIPIPTPEEIARHYSAAMDSVNLINNRLALAVKTERVKNYLQIHDKLVLKEFARNSENPTKGYLLFPEQVSDLISNKEYDRRDNAKEI